MSIKTKKEPPVKYAHGLVKKHGAKHAYSIANKYPWDRYFTEVSRAIAKYYQQDLLENAK